MSSKELEEKRVKKRSHSRSRSKSDKVVAEEKDVKKRSRSKSRSSPEKSKSSTRSDHNGKTSNDKDKSREVGQEKQHRPSERRTEEKSSSRPQEKTVVVPVIRDRSREKSRPPKIYTDEEKARLKKERQMREAKRELEKSRKSDEAKVAKKKEQQPRIVDKKVASDRKPKIESSTSKANLLPDKNVLKSKQLRQQHSLSTSKSSVDESSGVSNVSSKKRVSSRSKAEGSSKYDEKRGKSTVFAPKDSASKLKDSIKATESRTREDHRRPAKKKDSSSTSDDKITRERRRSRTLSPSEVRVLNNNNNAGKGQKEAAGVVDKNSVDDAAPAKNESDSEIDFNHLEEFEDYESDVDDFTIATQVNDDSDVSLLSLDLEPIILKTEEKRKLVMSAASVRREREDSNALNSEHYELAETRKRAAMVESLMAHRMKTPSPEPAVIGRSPPSDDVYRGEKQTESKSLASADEGFEDAKSGDFTKSPRVSQNNPVNTEKSRPEKIVEEPAKKTLTRGQILMSMIKLDTVEFSLYEAHPISYDEYIRTYGKLNSQQTYTQTNEDNLDVEIQTNLIELETKWTQFPVRCRSSLKTIDDVRQFKLDHLGSGSDVPGADQSSFFQAPTYDILRLTEFLDRAGKLMLALLEERELGGDVLASDSRDFPFSEGCVKLATGAISFLAGRQVRMLRYSEVNHKILMSVHAPSHEKFQLTDRQDYIKDCSVGCVWNINEPSRPTKMFYSPSPMTACCFHCTNNSIVFAGNQDGSICLWDLREDETWHQRISDKTNEMDWIVRSSTYTTAAVDDAESAHTASVVAINALMSASLDQESDGFFNIQLCSLDEDGRLIVWSVIRNLTTTTTTTTIKTVKDDDLGLAQWGRVKLVKSQEVPLLAARKMETGGLLKVFVDMAVDQADSDNLYLATNDTNVLYANCAGGRNSTPFYGINDMDSCGSTTCLEVFPYKRSYFLAGCKDGSIRLHSLHVETPLMKLKDEDSLAGISSIQWSRSRPTIFYILDDQSRIAVWDMRKSATRPIHAVATTNWESVKCIKLSPCNVERDKQNQYMAIGTYGGNVEVHKLQRDFYFSKQEDTQREMDAFLEFVSIL